MGTMIYIVHGPPAAGKTTIADLLRTRLGIPHIGADNLNEWIQDILGEAPLPSHTSKVGHELMFKLLGELSRGGGSFIIEGCLDCDVAGERIQETLKERSHWVCEIFVTASATVLLERYRARAEAGGRHPVHGAEGRKFNVLKQHIATKRYGVLGIADQTLSIKNEGKDLKDLEKELRRELGIV